MPHCCQRAVSFINRQRSLVQEGLHHFKATVCIRRVRRLFKYRQLSCIPLGTIFRPKPPSIYDHRIFYRRIFFVGTAHQSDVLSNLVTNHLLKDANYLWIRLFFKSDLIVSLRLFI